jgi:hypothetical protein
VWVAALKLSPLGPSGNRRAVGVRQALHGERHVVDQHVRERVVGRPEERALDLVHDLPSVGVEDGVELGGELLRRAGRLHELARPLERILVQPEREAERDARRHLLRLRPAELVGDLHVLGGG